MKKISTKFNTSISNMSNNTLKVLDHGFVKLIDHMGSDQAIVDAARVSYNSSTKKITKDNRSLIRYLMRNQHWTPFEMCEVKLHIKTPIFVARQWLRHRSGSYNEISARYSVLPSDFYVPDQIFEQSKTNKQCSSEELINDHNNTINSLRKEQEIAYQNYQKRIDNNVAREISRINLPVSIYTEFYVKMNLRNLLHFLKLRLHPHAQKEIRDYASAIFTLINPLFPLAVESWKDFELYTISLTKCDIEAFKELLRDLYFDLYDALYDMERYFPTKREFDEFKNKLDRLLD